jgi:hypothetical protein
MQQTALCISDNALLLVISQALLHVPNELLYKRCVVAANQPASTAHNAVADAAHS